MTSEDLQKLLDECTPGPWNVTDGMRARFIEVAGCHLAHFSKDEDGPKHREANARLIAMAPSLARRVIAAEALIQALSKQLTREPLIDVSAAEEIVAATLAYDEASNE